MSPPPIGGPRSLLGHHVGARHVLGAVGSARSSSTRRSVRSPPDRRGPRRSDDEGDHVTLVPTPTKRNLMRLSCSLGTGFLSLLGSRTDQLKRSANETLMARLTPL